MNDQPALAAAPAPPASAAHAPGAPPAPAALEEVDLLVVGGGKAGKSLAMDRAKKGMRVAMVERRYIGGTCINVACIPTKALVASARRLEAARSDARFGVTGTGAAAVDLEALRAHKEGIVSAMVAAHETMFAAPGLDFLKGEARFIGERSVEVALDEGGTRCIRGERALVNLGSRPARPEIPGLWEAGAMTSEEILRLEALPSSLAIIGASYIGVEFASMMAAFGVEVVLIASGAHVLPREDADIAAETEAGLAELGVEIRRGARVVAAAKEEGRIRLALDDGGSLAAEAVLVAAGRVPNTEGIGLEEAGIRLNASGFIAVDDSLRTSAPGVWAAGDAAGTPMFTHASWSDFRIIRAQFDGAEPASPFASTTGRLLPSVVFTSPELARIGMSEGEARASGREVLVASLPVQAVPRAKTMRASRGLWKAVVDASTHEILGAAIQGPEAGEVIAAVQVAMRAGMRYEELRFLPIAHPTMAEGLQLLLDQLP
ncbi:dihydrolipoyl dehydrogenase family protein [Schaalia hyovaginalis]|uniref:Pyruvate/2-oxoglutarate dehydrogenase complex dihydrolipoamide dehydrogenase (E3) component n=1 Tax=Schaalia hyovaginalis TaxID=29316 RepID=A0A923E690_9ACTO|nr:FAD-dependent oxidoreductase [Schaalia hyovaginalis]MBB6334351.1 pyruvate/2-oxoglutarate dehydrogenase complex dihydrolipoamide dehydrogenase (E3) component [Schaalia hyovaginalis]